MANVNILLIGRGAIAINGLEKLCGMGIRPVCVICDTYDDGKDTWTPSLFKRAKALEYKEHVNLFRERKVNTDEFLQNLRNKFPDVDIIFSLQPYAIFRKPFIALAKRYVVNLHLAPLPKLRGVAPCSWAFIDKLKDMGVTLHLIEDFGVDDGPIIAQKIFPIKPDDTAWTLFNKCIVNGKSLFNAHVRRILEGRFKVKKQNKELATYHPKNQLDFTNMEIDIQQKPKEIIAFVRSRIFPPLQLPYVMIYGQRKYIDKVKLSIKQGIWFKGRTMYYSGT